MMPRSARKKISALLTFCGRNHVPSLRRNEEREASWPTRKDSSMSRLSRSRARRRRQNCWACYKLISWFHAWETAQVNGFANKLKLERQTETLRYNALIVFLKLQHKRIWNSCETTKSDSNYISYADHFQFAPRMQTIFNLLLVCRPFSIYSSYADHF